MIDHQLKAAGERASDYASPRELQDFWMDRAYESLNSVRAAEGKPPVLRSRRTRRAGVAPVRITAGDRGVLVVVDADAADPNALLADERTVARWRALQDAFAAAQVEMANLVLGRS